MQCDQIRRYLPEYAEGSLPRYKVAWVAQHLAGCPACTAAAEEHRRVPLAAATADESEPAPVSTLFTEVERPVPVWLQVAAAALIMAAAGGAVWLVFA